MSLTATLEGPSAYSDDDYVSVATATNYDPKTDFFDTSSVEPVIAEVSLVNPQAYILIKSTIPVGLVDRMRSAMITDHMFFRLNF